MIQSCFCSNTNRKQKQYVERPKPTGSIQSTASVTAHSLLNSSRYRPVDQSSGEMHPLRVSCCSASAKLTDFRLILMSLKSVVEYFNDTKKINVSFRLFLAVVPPFPSISLSMHLCLDTSS